MTTPADTKPALGTPEYDAAMAAKLDNANAAAAAAGAPDTATTAKPAAKPEFIEDKFWDAEKGQVRTEDLAKSYKELQARLSQPKGEEPGKPAEGAKPEGQKPEGQKPEGGDPQKFDLKTYSQEYAEKGELSEASYQALANNGFSKEVVDTFIAGQKAQAAAIEAETFSVVGGKEQYSAMADWATKNLTEAEIAAFDNALDGSAEVRKLAVQGLFARYQAANGREPNLLNGGVPGDVVGYKSTAEMTRDMKDPRYQKDPAFRQSVANRLAVSNF